MNLNNNYLMKHAVFLSFILFVVIAFSFFLFGMTGIRLVLGIVFVSFPFYLLFNNFDLPEGEKFVFSLLTGLTLFSSSVYLLGIVISFRLSIIITFIMLIIVAVLLKKFKKSDKD